MRAVAGFSTPVPTMGAGAGVCRCPAAAAAAKPASLAALQQCNRARLNCRSLSDAAAPIQGSSFATTSTRRRVVTAAAAAGVTSAGGGAVAPPALDAAERPRARLAVFVSGGGSNMRAIHAACQSGQINADVAAVVSDVPSCGGVAFAQAAGIPTLTYPASRKGTFPGLSADELVQELTVTHKADYVLLAGFLKLIPPELCRAFKRRMLNIHPGLLPSFGGKGCYGERVHVAVIASGARFSGPTVHFVDEEYDTGPILAQRVVPVFPTDTPKRLAARVLEQEHLVYPHAVSALVDGRVTWREDGIPVLWEAH